MEIFIGKAEVKATREMLMKPFYEDLHDFFIEEDYAGDSDPDFPEILYSESENQKGVKEIWVWWRLSKKDVNGMMKFKIDCDLHGVGMSQTEIMHEGKRLKVDRGKFEVILRAKLYIDNSGYSGGILGSFFDFYKKRHMKKLIDGKKHECLKDLYKFADHAKSYFNVPTQNAVHEPFLPRLGYNDSKLK